MNELSKQIKKYLRSGKIDFIFADGLFYFCFHGKLVCFATTETTRSIVQGGAKIVRVYSLQDFVEKYREYQ